MNILEELFVIYENNNNSKNINEVWKTCLAGLYMIPKDSIDNVTGLIHSYAAECEKTGFKKGFQYGVNLMLECVFKDGDSNG